MPDRPNFPSGEVPSTFDRGAGDIGDGRLAASVSEHNTTSYTPHARAERLIAIGRLVLALSSLGAVYIEPSTPAQFQRATYGLLLIFTIYAMVAAVFAMRSAVPSARMRLLSHVSDLVIFSIFVYLTEGPASPFFLYFVFSLFCATLRFSWRGVLATGLTALAIYSLMALMASVGDSEGLASRVLIRLAYLAVTAALLIYLGIYQESLRSELSSLAGWPRELASRIDDLLRGTLLYAAGVVRTERLILLWEESEEPWTWVAMVSKGGFTIQKVPPGALDAPGDKPREGSFLVREDADSVLVYNPAQSTVEEAKGDPLGAGARERFGVKEAIVVSLHGETLSARMVIGEVRNATADDLALAHIVGRLVLATLEQFFFVRQVRQTASAEERLRISRDLHDGIVQSLAGVGLRLHSLRGLFPRNSDAARQLEHVQRVLEHDQRELRTLVRELRPDDRRDGGEVLQSELKRMRERFTLEWGMEVVVKMGEPLPLSARIAWEVCRIINESLSNAARHGGASKVTVTVAMNHTHVDLRVCDNGSGFPFFGRRDLGALERAGIGPRSLKERVRKLGGTMTIESSSSGAMIEARIPSQEESS